MTTPRHPRAAARFDRRARLRRASFAVGVVALLGVIIVAAVIALRPSPSPTQAERSAAGRALAERRQVRPTQTGAYTTWPIPLPDGMLTIPAVGRDGNAWIGTMGPNTLMLLHGTTGQYTAITFPDGPVHTIGSAVDTRGNAWLAQSNRNALGRFDLELRTYEEFPTPTADSSPFGIIVDSDEHVWFTELAAARIGLFDPASRLFKEYPLPDETLYPYLLAVAPDGRIWFSTLKTPYVGVLDPNDGTITLHRIAGMDDQTGTTGIAVAADGTVWFGARAGRLGRFDPASGESELFQSSGSDAYGVAVDSGGRVWLATTDAAVYAFDPATRAFCAVQTGPASRWVTAAADGSVWVAQGTGEKNAVGRIGPERAANPCG